MNPWELNYSADPAAKLAAQDKKLGLPAGTTAAQFKVESGMQAGAVSPKGAMGWAQIMPATQRTLEQRAGRKFDPTNLDDALTMHEMVMRENMQRFGNTDDALRAYNGGWKPETWGNKETSAYVPKIKANMSKPANVMPWDMQYGEPVPQESSPKSPQEFTSMERLVLGMPQKPTPKTNTAGQVVAGLGKGVKDMIDGLAYLAPKGLAQVASGFGSMPNAVSRGLESEAVRVSDMNKRGDQEFKELTGDTAAANVGRIGGNIATAFIPGVGTAQGAVGRVAANLWNKGGAVNKLKSLIPAAGLGAVQGTVLNTRTEDDSALSNAAGGAAGGVVGQAVVPVAKAVAKGVAGIAEPFVAKDRIVRRVVNQFATNPNPTISPANLPGIQQTAADVTGDAGLAQLQRALQSASPEFAATLDGLRKGNNAAMVGALRDIAGDDAAKQAAEQARNAAASPLYEQAKKSIVSVDGELARLMGNPYIADAMGRAKKITAGQERAFGTPGSKEKILQSPVLSDRGVPFSVSVPEKPSTLTGDALHNTKLALDDLIKDVNSGIGNTERRLVSGLKDRYVSEVEKRVPAYGQAQAAYRDLSRPINQQQIVQRLLDTKTSALRDSADNPRMLAESFARAIRGEDQLIKQATGRKGMGGLDDVMEPGQMDTINAILKVLQQQAATESGGRITGSQTAQLGAAQNVLGNSLRSVGLQSMAGWPVAGMVTRLMDTALKGPNQAIQDRLGEVILSPQLLQQVLQKANAPTPKMDAIGEALRKAITASGSLGGAAAMSQQ